jgi:hypothetical protein
MDIPSLDLKEISRYLEITGKKGGMVLSVLGKLQKELDSVVNSSLGSEILRLDILRLEELLVKIYNEQATGQELAEFRYLKNTRLPVIIGKIRKFYELTQEVKKNALAAT